MCGDGDGFFVGVYLCCEWVYVNDVVGDVFDCFDNCLVILVNGFVVFCSCGSELCM